MNYIKLFLNPSGPIEKYRMDYIGLINRYADANGLSEEERQELFNYDDLKLSSDWFKERNKNLFNTNLNYIKTLFPKNQKITQAYKDYLNAGLGSKRTFDYGKKLNELNPIEFLRLYYQDNTKLLRIIDKNLSKAIPGYNKRDIMLLNYTPEILDYFKIEHPGVNETIKAHDLFLTNLRMDDPKYSDVRKFYYDRILPIYQALDFMKSYYNSDGYKNRLEKSGLSYEPFNFSYVDINGDNITESSYNNSKIRYVNLGIKNLNTIEQGLVDALQLGLHEPDGVAAHELAHNNPLWNTYAPSREKTKESPYYGMDYSKIPLQLKGILLKYKDGVSADNDHDAELSEHYSDLLALRYYLYKYGIADLRQSDVVITPEMILRLRTEHPEIIDKIRFLRYHDDNTAVDALNLIASNFNSNNVLSAKLGGKISYLNIF